MFFHRVFSVILAATGTIAMATSAPVAVDSTITVGYAKAGAGSVETVTEKEMNHNQVSTALDAINGIGPKRKSDLLRHFHTLKAIRAASREELEKVLPRNAAAAVYSSFHREDDETCE